MNDSAGSHPFDSSLQFGSSAAGELILATDESYWNMASPFGGWLLAAGLKAVLVHPLARGEPVEAHARFLAAPKAGELAVLVERQSQGRSVGFWRVNISQDQPAGRRLCAEISVILAEARATSHHIAARMPDAPPPDRLPTANTASAPLQWLRRFHFRYVYGAPFKLAEDDPAVARLESLLWIQDALGRPLDWMSLAAFADVPAPRPFLLQTKQSPVATVSLSLYFHATNAEVLASPAWLLLKISGHAVRRGFFDHSVEIWNAGGVLLATSTQLAWFA